MQRLVEYLFRHIESKQRFHITDHLCLDLIEKIKSLSLKFGCELNSEHTFFRAQRGCVLKKNVMGNGHVAWTTIPFGPTRMIPRADKVVAGRLNPHGIAVLYLAENIETAVQELRPVPKEILTVAEFRSKQPLRVCRINYDVLSNDMSAPE
jgi:hypothetical protein